MHRRAWPHASSRFRSGRGDRPSTRRAQAAARCCRFCLASKLDSSYNRLIRHNVPAKLYSGARRYAQQVCRAPDDVALKLVHAIISVNDFPHHLDDLATAFFIEQIDKLTGEAVEINRVLLDRSGFIDQIDRLDIVALVIRVATVSHAMSEGEAGVASRSFEIALWARRDEGLDRSKHRDCLVRRVVRGAEGVFGRPER